MVGSRTSSFHNLLPQVAFSCPFPASRSHHPIHTFHHGNKDSNISMVTKDVVAVMRQFRPPSFLQGLGRRGLHRGVGIHLQVSVLFFTHNSLHSDSLSVCVRSNFELRTSIAPPTTTHLPAPPSLPPSLPLFECLCLNDATSVQY